MRHGENYVRLQAIHMENILSPNWTKLYILFRLSVQLFTGQPAGDILNSSLSIIFFIILDSVNWTWRVFMGFYEIYQRIYILNCFGQNRAWHKKILIENLVIQQSVSGHNVLATKRISYKTYRLLNVLAKKRIGRRNVSSDINFRTIFVILKNSPCYLFKVRVARDFLPLVFSSNEPALAPVWDPKIFLIWFQIHTYIYANLKFDWPLLL